MPKNPRNGIFLVKAAARRYLQLVLMNTLPFSTWRVFVLRLCGVHIGKDCYVGFGVMVDTNYPELITIGNSVTISHSCYIFTHTQTPALSRLGKTFDSVKGVKLFSGAWIGASSLILPGAVVEEDCMVGAGSTVRGTLRKGCLYMGNPAKLVREIFRDSY